MDQADWLLNLTPHLCGVGSLTGNEGWVPHCPDFLRRLMALIHSMRLSLMKGAHADLSSTAWQEIGVKPGFGLSGIPQHWTPIIG
jgi:hypothetical protein